MRAGTKRPGFWNRRDLGAGAAVLLAAGMWPSAGAADPAPRDTVLLQDLNAHYPQQCKRPMAGNTGATGLCLLVSINPKVSGDFRVRPYKDPRSGKPAADVPMPVNTVLALPPGDYEIFKATGIDSQNVAKVTVRENRVATVTTMTLRFKKTKPTVTYKIQRFQAVPGTNNGGCLAEFVNAGAHAYLPGNFLINPTNGGEQVNPKCELGGVTFNAVSGQGYTVKPGQVTEQVLTEAETYVHPNKVSALTSIAPAMHGISKIGWLTNWGSHQGIPNPDAKPHAALAFYGPGNYTYIVPFRFRRDAKACGLSLAQGLMPEAKLLTGCTFKQGRLSGFTVNKGSYFTYHNMYGIPGIAANNIRNAFTVENVNFKLPKGN
ncbi:hypothetical protein [Methylococcus mesophilus]|uniref:hypothetical protein n=1 Tax=Methylococcus mesophilus TaxID=2993564 RepID=UPI00224B6DF4|nr:hypothetical protein [Methylococcus mesophilus]UZR27945.1 hypothetical protein OOT43_14635 [Methylococcus mesophilus]